MDEFSAPAGVCVIRVDDRGSSNVRVTLRANLDISNSDGEWVFRTSDIELAHYVVLCFLRECAYRD